ncbi:MAG TPA: prepilin-type N-terminal cleavage/methylation domain-containing protein [Gemmatimonadaceae bacterium]|nr:prepilin-type N-terminal cleavage/methylation domain-containing protein [Gemmatimonadaceae bacterium]
MQAMTARSRRGFTLIELMITLVLLSFVAAALISVIVGQQRFYGDTNEIVEARGSMRQIAELLPSELHALSPSSGDIHKFADRGINFRATIGASIACTVDAANGIIVIPPTSLKRDNALTSWITTPVAGDSIVIFDSGVSPSQWRMYELAKVGGSANCPTYTADATEAAAGITLVTTDPLANTIPAGASIRFFHTAQYEAYQAADRRWYLGYFDCIPGRSPECTTIQPVSGPYATVDGSNASGVLFRYLDADGKVTADPTQVARIDVLARAESRDAMRGAGRAHAIYQDSIAFSIAVRN